MRLPLSSLPCTYKYGVRRADGSLALEAGENRMVALPVRTYLVTMCWGCWGHPGSGAPAPTAACLAGLRIKLLPTTACSSTLCSAQANDGTRAPALVARFDGCFRRQQRWRGAGVAVPVFSLRRC